jgi:hypothetical protein
MDDDRVRIEAEDRAVREAVTLGLTDQKTMNQLSSSGENAKDKRIEARAKREEAARAEAQEQASGDAGKGSGGG